MRSSRRSARLRRPTSIPSSMPPCGSAFMNWPRTPSSPIAWCWPRPWSSRSASARPTATSTSTPCWTGLRASCARSNMDEFELIRRYFERAGAERTDVELGVGDDAALLRVPEGAELVAAVDTLVEGRHFPSDADARSVGHRALAVNLSDIAAMGAVPAWATLALTLPSADAGWLDDFARGFGDLATAHGVAL